MSPTTSNNNNVKKQNYGSASIDMTTAKYYCPGLHITIHMPQKWILSSSVMRIFRKMRVNRIIVKQCIVFIANFDAQCNQKWGF